MDALERRLHDCRPVFGLSPSFSGRRWISRDGGPDDLALAHGEPRPDPSPLIVVGVMSIRQAERSVVDIHDSLGTMLVMEELTRSDPAFQQTTRDQGAIEHALRHIPGPDAWRPSAIEIDEVYRSCARLDGRDDWIAFTDLQDEVLYVHVQNPDGSTFALTTITEIGSYEATASG